MREILFRGKRVDNGEWISGSILSFDDGGKVILSSTAKVFKEHGTTTICCNECYDVYPETVGQYTGLTDKNGVKIFEGDIVTLPEETEPYEMRYVIQWEEDNARFIATAEGDTYSFDNIWGCQVEVIGNVHDNFELLKGVYNDKGRVVGCS